MHGVMVALAVGAVLPAGPKDDAPASQPAEVWAQIVSSADAGWGPEENELAGELLRQLSHPDFAQREEASRRLRDMGVGVFGLLAAEYRASRDLEKRLRIREIAMHLYFQVRLDWYEVGFLGIQMTSAAAGVRIVQVVPSSAAAEAGLRPDDIIFELDDQRVPVTAAVEGRAVPPTADVDAFRRMVAARRPGETMRLEVMRGGGILRVDVTLGRCPISYQPEPLRQTREIEFREANAEFEQLWAELFERPSDTPQTESSGS